MIQTRSFLPEEKAAGSSETLINIYMLIYMMSEPRNSTPKCYFYLASVCNTFV
jgi:hypothetical protein